MFTTLPTEAQAELAALADRFGQPLVRQVRLSNDGYLHPRNIADRLSEVCMVIQRRNGLLLTAKKTFYPEGAYRLLTGGINHQEPVLQALLREVNEETALEVRVQRFLAAVAYQIGEQESTPVFYTFAFLLTEVGGTLVNQDPYELVEYFREIAPEELPERAAFFSRLPDSESKELLASWRAWGEFRAVIHLLVWQALSQEVKQP